MTYLFRACLAIMAICTLLGFAFGSAVGGAVAGAALCIGLICEMGA